MKAAANPVSDWFFYEKECAERGFSAVCGIDEAGRGPLAGPVCAAAVILPVGEHIEGLNDSKKLSEKKRELLFDVITGTAISYSIAYATVEEIDRLNILQATFLAMRRAVCGLSAAADFALIDGDKSPGLDIPAAAIVGGDGKCESIAAASVLAKVARDHYMSEIAAEYPQYNFAKHKGYGTAEHKKLILEHGACPIHRRLFLRNILAERQA